MQETLADSEFTSTLGECRRPKCVCQQRRGGLDHVVPSHSAMWRRASVVAILGFSVATPRTSDVFSLQTGSRHSSSCTSNRSTEFVSADGIARRRSQLSRIQRAIVWQRHDEAEALLSALQVDEFGAPDQLRIAGLWVELAGELDRAQRWPAALSCYEAGARDRRSRSRSAGTFTHRLDSPNESRAEARVELSSYCRRSLPRVRPSLGRPWVVAPVDGSSGGGGPSARSLVATRRRPACIH